MKFQPTSKKQKILCLHGSKSSSALLKKETEVWPPFVLENMDLVFIDGPFPLPKESEHDDNLFTWYYSLSDHRDTSFEHCIAYIEDCMVKLGPFDGVLGFSQVYICIQIVYICVSNLLSHAHTSFNHIFE